MARAFANWQALFKLKCEYRDDFLTFYSKSKGIIHKLKKGNSVAVHDEVFLKAYFSMAIDAPELQSEVKKFLKDTSVSYSETLENIHADYRAQTTTENMRLKTSATSSSSTLRRGKVEFKVEEGDKEYFPPNVRRLLPTSYYTQFKAWYAHFTIPPDKRTPKEKEWVKNFSFDTRLEDERRGSYRDHSNMNDSAEPRPSRPRYEHSSGRPSYMASNQNRSRSHQDYSRRSSHDSNRTSRRTRHHDSRSLSPEKDDSQYSEYINEFAEYMY
jgi:anthranilate/para-aminobenzoate synthase component I